MHSNKRLEDRVSIAEEEEGNKIMVAAGIIVVVAIFFIASAAVTTTQITFGQTANPIIVLSHSFNTEVYPEIVGEVQNNSTRSYDKYDIDIVANFRDAAGTLVSSEEGYIDAETLGPGDSSAFNVVSFDESLPDKATTYDLIVEDDRVVVGAPLGEGSNDSSSSSDEVQSSEDNGSGDGGSGDGGSGDGGSGDGGDEGGGDEGGGA
jgi:uncharacterized membrane protein YgcG